MILIHFIGRLHILYDFHIDFIVSRCLNRPLDLHFGPKTDENQSFLAKVLNFVILQPETKVHGSIEAPGYDEININVTRDTQSTNKVDQNHLESKIWTLSRHFMQKYWFSSFLGPKLIFRDLLSHLTAVKLI